MVVLIDCRASHNFILIDLVAKLGILLVGTHSIDVLMDIGLLVLGTGLCTYNNKTLRSKHIFVLSYWVAPI